jgi:hypothetical protein
MAKLNFLLNINSYLDANSSNNPSLNVIKWARDFQGIAVEKPQSAQFSLAPGESRTVFDGTRTLLQDGTTQYQLSLKPGTTSTYVLKHVSGTAPQFRASRNTGADATTQVSVTKNGNVLTFASTGGTPLDLIVGSVVVGDKVSLGSVFSTANRGVFTIIARTATSLSVENSGGVVESGVVLGASFQDEIRIFGASGVQAGDTIRIFGAFSPSTQGSYEVSYAQDNLVEFYSTSSLPEETVTTNSVAIYSQAKRVIYIETDKKLSIQANGAQQGKVEPLVSGSDIKPGMLFKIETIWSLVVTNDSLEVANIYCASVE